MRNKQLLWVLQSIFTFMHFPCFSAFKQNGSRTFRGRPVDITEVPFIVLVVPENQSTCTGFIVARDWVISAAHCFEDGTKNAVVAIGTNDRGEWSIKIKAHMVIIHPRYLTLYDKYDIALIKLQRDIKMTSTSQVIKVEGQAWPKNQLRRLCYTAGYGRHVAVSKTGVLHGGQVTVGSGTYPYPCAFPIYDIGELLWTNRNESEPMCYGDSGCPLVCNKMVVGIGVVSYPCSESSFNSYSCENESVDGFVSLYRNLEWLRSYISCLPSSCNRGVSLFTLNQNSKFAFVTLLILVYTYKHIRLL